MAVMTTKPRYSRIDRPLQATFGLPVAPHAWLPPEYGISAPWLHAQLGNWRYGYGLVLYARRLGQPGLLVYTNSWGRRVRIPYQNWWLGERSDYG